MNRKLNLLGYGSGMGGVDEKTGLAPTTIFNSLHLTESPVNAFIASKKMVTPPPAMAAHDIKAIATLNQALALDVASLIRQKEALTVIGGDHTSAIGTWSGVHAAIKGALGLIWIDAHMDSHTPETSPSGRIHGMPLAALLGYGNPELINLLNPSPQIQPEHLCLIGVRSFEEGEAELLRKLNVKIFFMDEVKARGLKEIFAEAIQIVSHNTVGFGLSIDLDALDPSAVPGIDVPEQDGIQLKEMLKNLAPVLAEPRLLATEIVEFNPSKDQDQRTEKVVIQLLELIVKGIN